MSGTELERLRALPLFSECTDANLERIATVATTFEVESGHVLAERGQPGSGMFVILEGTVEVDVPNRDPVMLGPGEFFGELALLTEMDRLARVRAVTSVRGLAISRAAFDALLHEEPRIAAGMLPVLARRLAEAESGP
jgi:CRP-like cAMP-binding protein